MSATDSSADRDPLERLAEEFVARLRAGERPSIGEYADRHPDLAVEIRELFPALVEMEQLKPATGEHTGAFTPAAGPADPVRVGEFRILRRVGHGGMGVVYEAVQESLGRHVALKLLPSEALVDPRRLERFRREARAAAKLHHTNIVPVFGVGEADGRHYYAMQFISGHPLDAVIDEVKRLKDKSQVLPAAPRAVSEVAAALVTGSFARTAPHDSADGEPPTAPHDPAEPGSVPVGSPALSGSISDSGRHYWATVARLGAQVADALAYAHGQGIVHRDIKPSNLLLDLRGTVWVTDFGLAKATDADDLTHAGDVVGTLRYMAPERFENQGDHRVDTYALGLTLYELLTLKPAFRADSKAKLIEQVLTASPPAPRALNAQIPRDLETIVLKAIARDPAARYQSASEMADDLRRFIEDRPIRARRASSAEQAWRWCRRNKAVAALLTAVLLVFAVGAGVSAFFAVEAERKERDARAAAERADGESARVTQKATELEAEQARLRAERDRTGDLLYASRMNLAQAALDAGKVARAIELLNEMRPGPGERDLRGWEWHYLWRLTHSEAAAYPLPPTVAAAGGSPPHWIVRFTRDGRFAGLLLVDHSVNAEIKDVTFRVMDTTSGALVWTRTEKLHSPLDAQFFALSDDGRYLAFTAEGEDDGLRIRLFDTRADKELALPNPEFGYFGMLTVGPDAAWVAASTWPADAEVRPLGFEQEPGERERNRPLVVVWDRKNNVVRRVPRRPLPGSTLEPSFADVFPDGKTAVVTLIRPGAPRNAPAEAFEVWDFGGETPVRRFKLPGDTQNVTISPGGRVLLVSRKNGEWDVVSAADGKVEATHRRPARPERTLPGIALVSDDGRTIVLTQLNDPGRVHVAKRVPGEQRDVWSTFTIYHPEPTFNFFSLSGDGARLMHSANNLATIRVWDVSGNPDCPVAWPSDSDNEYRGPDVQVGAGGRVVLLQETRVGGPLGGGPGAPGDIDIKAVLLEPATGRALPALQFPEGRRARTQLSPDGARVLTASTPHRKFDGVGGGRTGWDAMESQWILADARTGRVVARSEAPARGISLGFSPDGRYVLTAGPKRPGEPHASSVEVREAATGKLLTAIPGPDGGMWTTCHFDRNGRLILTAPSRRMAPDGKLTHAAVHVACVNLTDGSTVWAKTISGPINWAVSVQEEHRRIAVAVSELGSAGTFARVEVRVLDADTGEERFRVVLPADVRGLHPWGGAPIQDVCFSPDGARLAVTSGREALVYALGTDRPPVRLLGHDRAVAAVRFDPTGRRAFTLEDPFNGEPGAAQSLKVWDLASGRELLTLAFARDGADVPVMLQTPATFGFTGGKLRVVTTGGVREYDGTPVRA